MTSLEARYGLLSKEGGRPTICFNFSLSLPCNGLVVQSNPLIVGRRPFCSPFPSRSRARQQLRSNGKPVRLTPRAAATVWQTLLNNGTFLRFSHAAVCNIPLFILLRTWDPPMLTRQGLLHAFALGLLLWTTSGPATYVVGFSFLLLGSVATVVGRARKQALGIAEARGGRRGPENLWGAAGVAALCSILAGLSRALAAKQMPGILNGSIWHVVSLYFTAAFCGAVASKSADTVSSEIGKAFGSRTFLLTTMREVSRGTEGAVSLEGSVAGIGAALATALLANRLNLLPNAASVVAVTAAATVANVAESLIGANFQSTANLTNEQVNFINTLIGAVFAAAFCYPNLLTR